MLGARQGKGMKLGFVLTVIKENKQGNADDDGVAQPAEKIWHLAEQ